MINKPFDQIDRVDVLNLIANEVREGRFLEYKEKAPGNSDGEKTEFLADVSSFANASGGYLVYGVREKRDENGRPTGVPESADGLERMNADSEILRLESIIRTGADARIPGVRTRILEGFSKGPVLIMWIPKSWSSPHMVVLSMRFGRPLDFSGARITTKTATGNRRLDQIFPVTAGCAHKKPSVARPLTKQPSVPFVSPVQSACCFRATP